MSEIIRKSGCLCGAVQLTITGEPAVMTYCHCESCRRWIGAPVHAGCLFPAENVRIELPNEGSGLVPDTEWKKEKYQEDWIEGETISVAIGQGPFDTVLTEAHGGMEKRPVVMS